MDVVTLAGSGQQADEPNNLVLETIKLESAKM
jgi:hypothetical protein